MRDWVTNVADTHYLLGTVAGPHPFPTMVRDFHKIIGEEAREQMLALTGRLPDASAWHVLVEDQMQSEFLMLLSPDTVCAFNRSGSWR